MSDNGLIDFALKAFGLFLMMMGGSSWEVSCRSDIKGTLKDAAYSILAIVLWLVGSAIFWHHR